MNESKKYAASLKLLAQIRKENEFQMSEAKWLSCARSALQDEDKELALEHLEVVAALLRVKSRAIQYLIDKVKADEEGA